VAKVAGGKIVCHWARARPGQKLGKDGWMTKWQRAMIYRMQANGFGGRRAEVEWLFCSAHRAAGDQFSINW
jgi:hypothetical protein